jgi:glycosyltransferase involved in cell wall biosynthesis
MFLSKKRVLLVGPFPPPTGGDTISTSALLSSRYWEDGGFEIEPLNTSGGGGVKPVIPRRTWRDGFRAIRILGRLLILLPRADMILLWANSSFICSLGIPVMRLIRSAGKPYIVKVFGTMLPDRIVRLNRRRKRILLSLLGGARYILPQTRIQVDELAAFPGLDPGRIVQFPNFLPDSYISREHRERKFSGRCVFIGQIKEEKGVFDIIESIRNRKEITCDFYGQPAEWDMDRFTGELAGCPNCIYKGVLPREEVMSVLGEYDVLLLPTIYPGEGYPAVILEAFASGIPVVATSWKAIPELVEDGVTGLLVPPSSPERIADALDLLAGDDRLYSSMASNAHGYIKRFSEKNVVGDFLLNLVSSSIDQAPKSDRTLS